MSAACTSGSANATIKGNTTKAQDDAAGGSGTAAQYAWRQNNPADVADAPDFSDALIQAARQRMAADLLTKSNRRDALANNPGATSSTSYSLLGS